MRHVNASIRSAIIFQKRNADGKRNVAGEISGIATGLALC